MAALALDEYSELRALYEEGSTGVFTIRKPLNAWGRNVLDTTRVLGDIDGKVSVFILNGGPAINRAGDTGPVVYFPKKLRPAEDFLHTERAGLNRPEVFTRGIKCASFAEFYQAQSAHSKAWIAGVMVAIFGSLALREVWRGLKG